MDYTSNRVKKLSESATIAMARKARELKAQGKLQFKFGGA